MSGSATTRPLPGNINTERCQFRSSPNAMFNKVMDALVIIQQLNKSLSHFCRGHSFFFQGERINVVAADVAKQQRCVRRIQPKPKPKNPPCEMNIPQIDNALCRAILGANPNYAPIIDRGVSVSETGLSQAG
jgi:hypothetical protein